MSASPFLSLYSVIALASGLVPIAIFLFAVLNYSSHRKAAVFVMLGCAMLVLSFVGSLGVGMVASRYWSPETIGKYIMGANSVALILQACGIGLLAYAAFVDRKVRNPEQPGQKNSTTGRESSGKPIETSNPYQPPVR